MARETLAPERRARAAGLQSFGPSWKPDARATAPGRIELIGNHLDYNGGPVIAAAIDREVIALRQTHRGNGPVSVTLADIDDEPSTFLLSDLADWSNPEDAIQPRDYVRAVLAALLSRGHQVADRAEVVVASNVPRGLGVSSSAALCVALSLALSETELSKPELVLTAQEAEHRAGTPCGTMDQSASVAGGVIRFDGATLDVQKLDPGLGRFTFVIADSGVNRSLGSSAYPTRVAESRRALELANAAVSETLPSLAAMTSQQLARLADDGVLAGDLLRRTRHVVSEVERVSKAERAMAEADWPSFGALMTASGRSSAGDYDISHPRVEELVAEILDVSGVLGARMMGGGGGGSVLALVDEEAVADLEHRLAAGYLQRYGMIDRDEAVQRCRFGPAASLETLRD